MYNGIVITNNEISKIHRCGFREQNNHCIDLSNSVSPDNGDATISDCTFTCSTARTQAGIYQKGSGGSKIISCKFVSGGNMVYGIQSVFPAGFSTSDLLVCNCSIELFSTSGILITVSGAATFYNVAIVGCNISSYSGGQGITLNGTGATRFSDISIIGNNINNGTYGINMASATNVNIAGNVFSNNSIQDVARASSTVNTGFTGDNNGSTPTNTTTPVAWSAITLYTSAGPTSYRVPLYQ